MTILFPIAVSIAVTLKRVYREAMEVVLMIDMNDGRWAHRDVMTSHTTIYIYLPLVVGT